MSAMAKRLPVVCVPSGQSGGTPLLREAERDRCVAVFRALGDPTRLEVFRAIAGNGGAICVCEITERFDVSQPTISHHLRVLREAGLVSCEKRGVWAYYEVDPAGAGAVLAAFSSAFPAAGVST